MKLDSFVNSVFKFGSRFYLHYIDEDNQLAKNLYDKLLEKNVKVYRSVENKIKHNSKEYSLVDVFIIIETNIHCPINTSAMIVDLTAGRDLTTIFKDIKWGDTSDFVLWDDQTESLIPDDILLDTSIERTLYERSNDLIISVEQQLEKRYPLLYPYYVNKKLFTIYAGPIYNFNFLGLNTLNVYNLISHAFQQGYEKIIFMNPDEGLQHRHLHKAHRIASLFLDKCHEGTFFYATASLNGNEGYKAWCDENNFKPAMHILSDNSFDIVAGSCAHAEYNVHESFLHQNDYSTPRENKYINLNRVPRPHRVFLISELLKSNLIPSGYNSFDPLLHTSSDIWEKIELDYSTHNGTDFVMDVYRCLLERRDQFPFVLNMSNTRSNPVSVTEDDYRYTKNCYFSIVCETNFFVKNYAKYPSTVFNGLDSPYFGNDTVFLSEKTFKPIVYGHPFILLGEPNSLRELKKLGYQTFSTWINEDYDSIEDDNDRFSFLIEEIRRLCSISDVSWLNMLKEMEPVIIHNFYNLYKNENKIYTTFDYMKYFK